MCVNFMPSNQMQVGVEVAMSIAYSRQGTLPKTLHGLSPRANYTDRTTADCRRSDCQLLRIEGATWSL
jgi:hypothetical protein